MRTQCCREKIDKIAEICELDPHTKNEIKRVAEFCRKHGEISQLTTDAVKPLFYETTPIAQERAISHIQDRLKRKTPKGGRYEKRLSKNEVKRILRKVKMEIHREELARKASVLPELPHIHHADFLTQYTLIKKASVDCIITDPPYVREWLHNYEIFAEAAEYVLKPGGFLISYVGHIHLDKILAQMTPHLDYYWIAALKHVGTTKAVHSRSVQCGFKPILIFNKPPRTQPKRYFNDVILGTGKEKDAHAWQQGEEELRQIFEPFTDPGDTVLDPFMGSGTVIAMAKKMNRLAIGFDLDAENVEIAKGRVAAYV